MTHFCSSVSKFYKSLGVRPMYVSFGVDLCSVMLLWIFVYFKFLNFSPFFSVTIVSPFMYSRLKSRLYYLRFSVGLFHSKFYPKICMTFIVICPSIYIKLILFCLLNSGRLG